MQASATPAGGRAPTGTERFRRGYARFLEWIVSGLMVLLALEVVIGIVFRVSGRSLVWYDEMASVMLAWLTFYGSALASVMRGHIACPEVVNQLPDGARRTVNAFAQVLVILFFLLLGYVGLTIMPMLAGDTLVSLPIPMNLVQSVIPISAAMIVVAEFTHLVDMLGRARMPETHGGVALSDGLH
jgi:TRAP-type C4-dicarboxylate transport system permease small subunit